MIGSAAGGESGEVRYDWQTMETGLVVVPGTDGLTCAVLVHLHRSVVHLRHGLHLDVVAVAIVFPLPVDVCGEVLCHVVGKIVGILHLGGKKRQKTLLTGTR